MSEDIARLLRLRAQRVERAQRDLRTAQIALQQAEQACMQAHQQCQSCAEALPQKSRQLFAPILQEHIGLATLHHTRGAESQLHLELAELQTAYTQAQETRAQAEEEVATQQQVLQSARRKQEAMRLLAQQHDTAQQQAEQRAQDEQIDEFAEQAFWQKTNERI